MVPLSSHCRGTNSIPGWGTKIPHAMGQGQKIAAQFGILYYKQTNRRRWANVKAIMSVLCENSRCSQLATREAEEPNICIFNNVLSSDTLEEAGEADLV